MIFTNLSMVESSVTKDRATSTREWRRASPPLLRPLKRGRHRRESPHTSMPNAILKRLERARRDGLRPPPRHGPTPRATARRRGEDASIMGNVRPLLLASQFILGIRPRGDHSDGKGFESERPRNR